MAAPPEIRPATHADVEAYAAHLDRQLPESGRDGDLVFTPYPPGETPWRSDGGFVPKLLPRWQRSLAEPNWERAWGLWDGERIVGHCYLRGGPVTATLHRGTLGMGLERAYRGQGQGGRLMAAVIAWAQAQPELSWIDLRVFAHNAPAIALYERQGFTTYARLSDALRIGGQQVDELHMTLAVTHD